MKRIVLPIVIGLIGFGLFFTSAALAASKQPQAAPPAPGRSQYGDTLTDTEPLSPTTTVTHPVASAIAERFGTDYSEIAGLHEEGLGFGVIAHAYFIAETLDITATEVISEFQSGKGWGVIVKEYGLPHGVAGRDRNLSSIMSGRYRNQTMVTMGDAGMPPGQLKKNQLPPGQLKKWAGEDGEGRGGPPDTPPGQGKDKGKGKGKK